MVAGAARIRVTFAVDADGLLQVEAEEQGSGVKSAVTVKPSYGLTDDEIAGMLRDSMDHARDDMVARQLREEQVEAERVVEALRAALAADGDALLDDAERVTVETALAGLAAAASGSDPAAIRRARESLEKTCEFYVERRMNASIRSALAGHKLDEFE
jgi:molecular chaperone HscA